MALPGFTAADALYRSTRTYRATTAHAPGATGLTPATLVDYDCTGKPDGDYIHPDDCTKFISCVGQQYAYEQPCAECNVDPESCPTGRLRYDHSLDSCVWADEVGCVTDPSRGRG